MGPGEVIEIQPRRVIGGSLAPSPAPREPTPAASCQASPSSTRIASCSSNVNPVAASTQAVSRGRSEGSGGGASHSLTEVPLSVSRNRPSGLNATRVTQLGPELEPE